MKWKHTLLIDIDIFRPEMENNIKKRITAVIVTYNPNEEKLGCIIDNISEQVSSIIIIDNSSTKLSLGIIAKDKVKYTPLGTNRGIAYAQNVGFLEAYKDSDFIITFDQDSNVSNTFINDLYSEYNRLIDAGVNHVACIGPSVINERDGNVYEKYFIGSSEICQGAFAVKSVISSGTLYPVDSFAYIGLNKAHWFIDSIDIEWCYRARSIGYQVIMTRNVTMLHNLGMDDKKLIGGKKINFGAPIRLYYVYRNWIFSLREPSFDLKYKLKIIINIPIKFCLFSTIAPKLERKKYMLKGIVDGFLGRGDKIS